MRMRFGVVLALTVTFGCAPSLSTFQPAHVPPKGHAAVSVGFEAGVPVGSIDALIDSGKTLSQRGQAGESLTTEEKWQIFDAGINLMLNLPSFGPHFAVAFTPVNRLELAIRYAGTAWRLGARYQVLDHLSGPFDFTVGLGLSRFTYEFPLSDQIPVLKLEDFSRWQLDIPALIGTSRDFLRVWIGPKVLLTKFQTQLVLTLPSETTIASFEGTAAFIGGQGGIALGYKYVFLAFELTLAKSLGTVHLTAPVLGEHDTNLSSFVVFPSAGLLAEF